MVIRMISSILLIVKMASIGILILSDNFDFKISLVLIGLAVYEWQSNFANKDLMRIVAKNQEKKSKDYHSEELDIKSGQSVGTEFHFMFCLVLIYCLVYFGNIVKHEFKYDQDNIT